MISKRDLLLAAAGTAAAASSARAETPYEQSLHPRAELKPLKPLRRIACEETFTVREIYDATARLSAAKGNVAGLMPNLAAVQDFYREAAMEVGPKRLAKMDQDGISMQLLSLGSPGVQVFDAAEGTALAALANDKLAAAIARHPTRFAGLAAVAPQDSAAAGKELQRAVTTLGLKGAIINSHTNDEYLDDKKFWPIFEAAQALDVPIYIHPRSPPAATDGTLKIRGFTVGWSYGVETGSHILKMMAAGVFDRFPRLKIVIGHMGEMIPLYLDRIDNRHAFEWGFAGQRSPLALKPSEYFKRNIWITTSGVNYPGPLRLAKEAIGVERILFAADYPYEDQHQASLAIDAAPLSDADRTAILSGNASRLFKL